MGSATTIPLVSVVVLLISFANAVNLSRPNLKLSSSVQAVEEVEELQAAKKPDLEAMLLPFHLLLYASIGIFIAFLIATGVMVWMHRNKQSLRISANSTSEILNQTDSSSEALLLNSCQP
eukprot:GILI01014866.1.p1 GENE.GILI01014866.1~~GILI01014866.1.p1  ORF type:complete len:136 (+),score=23.49 GILI01014866.1:51-410(+)